MKFVEEWKNEEVNQTYNQYKVWFEKLEELRNIWKTQGGSDNFNRLQSHKYSSKGFYGLSYHGNQSEENIKRIIRKSVDQHFENLQAKVEAKIGKIIEIVKINGNIYSFVGENGNCNVEVILAGGYNIQRLHTRWIITKNLDR